MANNFSRALLFALTAATAANAAVQKPAQPEAELRKTPPGIEKPSFPPVLGGVVKSDNWKMLRSKGLEIFEGNVSYKNPDYSLKAGFAEIDRNKGLVHARGGIEGERFWPNGNRSQAAADRAEYSIKTEKAQLYPQKGKKAALTHTDIKKGTLKTLSDSVVFDGRAKNFLLEGDAEIMGKDINTLSKNALYSYSTDTFELYGEPVIWGTYQSYDFAITGSSAAASNFYENIKFEGNIRGWLRTSTEVYKQYGTTVR